MIVNWKINTTRFVHFHGNLYTLIKSSHQPIVIAGFNIDSPYYVFVALCIVVIVVSLIKIAASNENIEYFREYFAVGYRAPDPSFF